MVMTKLPQSNEKQEERKPGTLDFLSSEEQIRVQRLLDLCEEKEPTHVATQTINSVARPNVVATVATQTAPLIATEISETVQL